MYPESPQLSCPYMVKGWTEWDNGTVSAYEPTSSDFTVILKCGDSLGTRSLDGTPSSCIKVRTSVPSVKSCPGVGNPIRPLDGTKDQTIDIVAWGRQHALRATYAGLRQRLNVGIDARGQRSFGSTWFSNLHRGVNVEAYGWGSAYQQYQFQRGDGIWKTFVASGTAAASVLEVDRIPTAPSSGQNRWLYFDATAGAVELHTGTVSAELTKIGYIDGRSLSYTYGDVILNQSERVKDLTGTRVLLSITDESGRRLSFEYEPDVRFTPYSWVPRIKAVIDPAGRRYEFRYGGQELIAVMYPDGNSRRYEYVNGLLARMIGEDDVVLGRYIYDDDGRAISTQTGSVGPQWQTAWDRAPTWTFVEEVVESNRLAVRTLRPPEAVTATLAGPDGRTSTMTSEVIGGTAMLKSRSQPAGAGCEAATSSMDYDAAGNVVRRVDFNGRQSCHAYVAGRHLESTRVEGLAAGAACSASLPAGATLPADARKVSSQWHPDWRMATRTAEPRRITTFVYNGQPDPFNGNAVASCAPASALLPDGKPIVVLCKRVEQATTDESGAQGFNATLQSGVPARSTSWTYEATGQVLTETDPRGKVVVTNEYYTDTTTDHTKGDLKSSMNSAGHLTQFPHYNAYGKPLEVVDANLVSTTYGYDARQRLTYVSTGGSTTSYEYWPTGLLKKTTQPDGAIVTYEYDDAHRLTAVADGQGNRIEYTLDQSGNRTAEVAKDPQGTLKRTMSRVFDALGRAQQTTGRE
jgi:YD repeat-containing protein